MPDIALRLNLDMLVLSAPTERRVVGDSSDLDADLAYLALMEPETLAEPLRLEQVAGAQCLVPSTEFLTPARLRRCRVEGSAELLAKNVLESTFELEPQHVLAPIGPCGLPLDPESKSSLNENRAEYAAAVRVLDAFDVDALFLDGFASLADLKCALMGTLQITGKPVFCSVDADVEGGLDGGRSTVEEAASLAQDMGAAVFGFSTPAAPLAAAQIARRAAGACDLPLLAQLQVGTVNPRQFEATPENPYYHPDTMVKAAAQLYAAGVQFLRATGAATPAYTGALVATVTGLDVRPR